MMIKLRNKGIQGFLLRFAWGPRRVTSRERYGNASAYPDAVRAGHRTWIAWVVQNFPRWIKKEYRIVLPKTTAKARVSDQIKDIIEEIEEEAKPTLSDSEIEEIQERRRALRAERNFEEADKLRDILVENGVTPEDKKLDAPAES